MNRKEERNNNFLDVLKEIKGYRFKVFVHDDPEYTYGYIVTENDNVLYIQLDYYYGYDFSLGYIPMRNCGDGCSCNDKPIVEISKSILDQLELDGLAFAGKLNAKLYNNSGEFFESLWNKDSLKEV